MAVNTVVQTSTAYPTTGFGAHNMNIDTNADVIEKSYIVDQPLIDGEKILTIRERFVYFTAQKVRHSSFCYFYRAKQFTLPNLGICTVGGMSD
jgi:hypothetical protein